MAAVLELFQTKWDQAALAQTFLAGVLGSGDQMTVKRSFYLYLSDGEVGLNTWQRCNQGASLHLGENSPKK